MIQILTKLVTRKKKKQKNRVYSSEIIEYNRTIIVMIITMHACTLNDQLAARSVYHRGKKKLQSNGY